MSISVLRTADAWWVLTPTGAAKVHTSANTTASQITRGCDAGLESNVAMSALHSRISETTRTLSGRSSATGRPTSR